MDADEKRGRRRTNAYLAILASGEYVALVRSKAEDRAVLLVERMEEAGAVLNGVCVLAQRRFVARGKRDVNSHGGGGGGVEGDVRSGMTAEGTGVAIINVTWLARWEACRL